MAVTAAARATTRLLGRLSAKKDTRGLHLGQRCWHPVLDINRPQPARQPRRSGPVIFGERGVRVHLGVVPFPQNELGPMLLQVRMEFGPSASLHAVIGPQHLRAIGSFRGIEGRAAVGARKGVMIRRMPVLSTHDAIRSPHQTVAHRHHRSEPLARRMGRRPFIPS